MMIYICFLFVNSFPITSGIVEAILWSKKGTEATPKNEHIYIVLQRASFFLSLIAIVFVPKEVFPLVGLLVSSLLTYAYLHDGAYYWFRNKIDPKVYLEKWKAESTTSTAVFEFTHKQRVSMAILGALLFVFSLL